MYDELIKMLRVCGDSNNSCGNCPVCENDGSCPHGEWEFAAEKYMLQAADAIEHMQKTILRLENELGIYDDLPMVDQREPPKEEQGDV